MNQALEDAQSLALLLETARTSTLHNGTIHNGTSSVNEQLLGALNRWQKYRQEKVDLIFDWTNSTTNIARLPEEERAKLIAAGKIDPSKYDDMTWLYKPSIEENVTEWFKDT